MMVPAASASLARARRGDPVEEVVLANFPAYMRRTIVETVTARSSIAR